MPLKQPTGLSPEDLYELNEGEGFLGVRLDNGDELILKVTEDTHNDEWLYSLELNFQHENLPVSVIQLVEEMLRERIDRLFARDDFHLYPTIGRLDDPIRVDNVATGKKLGLTLHASPEASDVYWVGRVTASKVMTFWIADSIWVRLEE